MVKKPTSRFKAKPTTPPPAADNWVKQGGADPEIQPEQPDEEAIATLTSEESSKGKYPHRISFDMATPQYKRLKRASFEEETPMNEILREAVEDWLKSRDY